MLIRRTIVAGLVLVIGSVAVGQSKKWQFWRSGPAIPIGKPDSDGYRPFLEYGAVQLEFKNSRYAKEHFDFLKRYDFQPVVVVSESGTAGHFVVLKTENITRSGCDIVGWGMGGKMNYKAEVGYILIGNRKG